MTTEKKVFKTNLNQQYDVIQAMQRDGYNVCTCGNCGDVVLFDKQMMEAGEIQCPHCKAILEYCDYPDLYHEYVYPKVNNVVKFGVTNNYTLNIGAKTFEVWVRWRDYDGQWELYEHFCMDGPVDSLNHDEQHALEQWIKTIDH